MTGAIDRPSAVHTRIAAGRARLLVGITLSAVAYAALPYIAGLAGGVMLAVLLMPLHEVLAPRVGKRRSSLLATLAAALLLVAPVALLLVAAIQEAPAALNRILESNALARISALRIRDVDVGVLLGDAARRIITWGSGRTMAAAGSLTHAILNLFIALLGLYYLLPEHHRVWRQVRAYIPFSASNADHMAERFNSITHSALLGIVATALSQGVTIGLAFWGFSLPNPVFWASVTALASILPILGSALVWLPGTIVLAVDQRIGAAIGLFLVGAVICSNIDNVIRPIVFRRVSGLHPMLSLVGAFAGMRLFGFIGIVLGPLAFAYALELLRLYELEYGAGKA